MKKHLGLHKLSPAVLKIRAAAQQLAACSCATPERDATDAEVLKKQLNEIQAQVAAMQTATTRKAKVNCPDTTEIGSLKRQIADVQAQVADMKKAAHVTKSGQQEATEIKALKHQLALLQAQVASAQVQGQQILSPAFSRDSSMTARLQSPNKRVNTQSSSGSTANGRPRPWYCFRCGEDAHLAVNCDGEPNPFLVEEMRQLLKERQRQWDQQNGSTGIQQLNY